MAIKKIDDGKYEIIIELGNDIFGKRRRKRKVFYGNLAQAKKEKIELEREYYHKCEEMTPENLTFRAYSKIYTEKYDKVRNSKITIQNNEFLLERINKIIGGIKLCSITPFILENMYDELRYKDRDVPLSAESILHYYRLINSMLNQAVKWGFLKENPNSNIPKPKKTKTNIKFYDEPQVDKLLECLENESIKYKALIKLAVDTGMRRGEIVALKWDDINFDTNEVVIDNSLKVIKGVVDEEKAKTESSIRTIYISDDTIDILLEYKNWQDEYIKQMGKAWKNENRIFTAKDGTHMNPSTPYKIITKVAKKYKLDDISFHGLRHTSATILLENGLPQKATSERLGHSSPTTTMGIYAHTTKKAKQQSADIINKIFKKAYN